MKCDFFNIYFRSVLWAENKSLKESNETSSVTENDSGSVTDKGKNILKKIKNPFKKFNDWSKNQKKTIF